MVSCHLAGRKIHGLLERCFCSFRVFIGEQDLAQPDMGHRVFGAKIHTAPGGFDGLVQFPEPGSRLDLHRRQTSRRGYRGLQQRKVLVHLANTIQAQ